MEIKQTSLFDSLIKLNPHDRYLMLMVLEIAESEVTNKEQYQFLKNLMYHLRRH